MRTSLPASRIHQIHRVLRVVVALALVAVCLSRYRVEVYRIEREARNQASAATKARWSNVWGSRVKKIDVMRAENNELKARLRSALNERRILRDTLGLPAKADPR